MLQDLKEESELWLINNDWSLEYARPVMPNTIFMGGILAKPATSLPQVMQELDFFESWCSGAKSYRVL